MFLCDYALNYTFILSESKVGFYELKKILTKMLISFKKHIRRKKPNEC